MDDPRVARRSAIVAGLCVVVLSYSVSARADYPVRHAVYQQGTLVASPIQQVSYQAKANPVTNVSNVTNVSYSTSEAGKQVKWITVGSPEARVVRDSEVVPAAASSDSTVHRVEPIPTVVPCRPRIRPVQGTEHSLLPALDDSEETLPLSLPDDTGVATPEEIPAPAPADTLRAEGDLPGIEGLNVVPMPETTELPSVGDALEDDGIEMPSDTKKPGAIGNNMQNQGGLENATDANGTERLPSQMPKSDSNYENIPEPATTDMSLEFANTENFACPRPKDMKAIRDITNDISAPGANFPPDCPLTAVGEVFPTRQFAGTNVTWTASNLCHNPLYFEQPALERYGHTCGPLQPVLSGAQFLLTVPALPYLMAMDPVNECQYPLGHYRPGSCAPYKWNPFPYSTRAAIAEGGIVTALVFLIP